MKKWLLLIVVGLSSVAASGCDDDDIPEDKFITYDAYIQPILTARCVRCHGGGGKLNSDPELVAPTGPLKTYAPTPANPDGLPPTQGYFDCGSEDRGDCSTDGPSCKRGFGYYGANKGGAGSTKLWLPLMPPGPATELTTRESELLNRWLANPNRDSSTCKRP